MDEQEQNTTTNFQLYGAIFALVLYFGAISPWETSLAELKERVEEQSRKAANPAKFINKARIASQKLEKKKKLYVRFLSNLPSVNVEEKEELTTLQRFAVVVSSCASHNIPTPDILPVPKIENQFFTANGCSFSVVVKDERTVYKLLRTIRLHESEPRIRAFTMSRSRSGGINASITISWPSYNKAGLSVAKGVKTEVITIPDKNEVGKWALFNPPKKKTAPMKSIGGKVKEGSKAQPSGDVALKKDTKSPGKDGDIPAGGKGSAKDEKEPDGKSSAAGSSLKGISLLGTISIAGIDGIIIPSGGKQKIILVGETLKDWELVSVTSDGARLRKEGRVVEVKLVRKTFLTDAPADDKTEAESKAEAGASILAKIPDPRQLGLHAILSSSSKVKGGAEIKKEGFRKGMLVRGVDVDSLAADARLLAGDFIYKIDDKPVRTPTQMRVAASKVSRNETVAFVLLRDGITREISCSN